MHNGKSGFKSRVLGSVSIVALGLIAQGIIAQPVLAQAEKDVETVVVTGSQIQRSGFQTPTPVTTVSTVELEQKAIANVSALQYDIPEFKPNQDSSANNLPIAGANLDLRGLGSVRTLVLLDNRRIEATNPNGGVDVTIIPGSLITGIDIVTGGASAAYGSDAVSGVVNIHLNSKFEGFKLVAQHGQTAYNDVLENDISGTAGTAFLGGRGHAEMALDYYNNDGEQNESTRAWGNKQACQTNNPNYTADGTHGAKNILAFGCTWSNMTNGGLIISGPLKGTMFLPGGATQQMVYGATVGTFWQIGGNGDQEQDFAPIYPKQTRESGYGRVTYDIDDDTSVWSELLYTRQSGYYHLVSNYDTSPGLTIRNDNAYLSTALKAAMATNKITSFAFGRSGLDTGFGGNYSVSTVGRFAAGASGKLKEFPFGSDWSWDTYIQLSRNHYLAQVPNNRLQQAWFNAVDSIISPTTGQPICRVLLTTPTSNCLPANVFGYGSISQASQATFIGTSTQVEHENADNFAANLRGTPLSLWAGDISFAMGYEYRVERINGTADANSIANNWRTNNPKPLAGSQTVNEGYLEFVIPLLSPMPWVQKLETELDGRITDYRTSGMVETWRVGLTYQPVDDLRLRGTLSHDIRAPTLFELFAPGGTVIGNAITDPFRPNSQGAPAGYTVQSVSGGNPLLLPEIADTRTAGFVFSPSFLEGFRASVDYYNINIGGAIGSAGALQNTIDNCYAGQTSLCSAIIRDPGTGLITQVRTGSINAQKLKERGMDFEADYKIELSDIAKDTGGDVRFRLLANYVANVITINNNVATDNAGQVSSGLPNWRINFGGTYTNNPFIFNFLVRYTEGGTYNATYVQGVDINNNYIPSATYVDLGLTYNYSDNWQLYAKGTNIFDVDPPVPVTGNISLNRASTSPFYDLLGARWAVGVRFNM